MPGAASSHISFIDKELIDMIVGINNVGLTPAIYYV